MYRVTILTLQVVLLMLLYQISIESNFNVPSQFHRVKKRASNKYPFEYFECSVKELQTVLIPYSIKTTLQFILEINYNYYSLTFFKCTENKIAIENVLGLLRVLVKRTIKLYTQIQENML